MKKKLSKTEIRGPDPLVRGIRRLQQRLLPYIKPLLIFSGVLMFSGGGYSLYKGHLSRVELKAQEAYFLNKKSLKNQRESLNSKKVGDKKKGDDKITSSSSKPEKRDILEDYGKQITEFHRIISGYPRTTARILSGFTLSDLYVEYEQREKALEILESMGSFIDKDSVLYGLLNLRLAHLKSEVGKCIEAIPTLQKINTNKKLSFLFAESLLRQAICYESLGQLNEAERIYKDLDGNYPNTDQGRSAKIYARLLKQKDFL